MTLLNVSFGIYAFIPQGWLFMAAIIILECLALSQLLTKAWYNKQVYKVVAISNVISGIIGIAGSMAVNGGWWLVVWFPWVSDYEVKGTEAIKGLAILYLIAFILTLIIEGGVNILMLKKNHDTSKIIKSTLLINLLSYLFGTIAMYSYSFG